MSHRSKYESGDEVIWFKSSKANGDSWLSNFFPDLPRAALQAVYLKNPDLLTDDSNDPQFSFVVDQLRYPTVEHFYHSAKYREKNERIAEELRLSGSAQEAKSLNNLYKWDHPVNLSKSECENLMLIGLQAKFSQNPQLKLLLKSTNTKTLAEVPGRDSENIWVGLGGSLGRLLTKVRTEISH